jgi:hypothetical protein
MRTSFIAVGALLVAVSGSIPVSAEEGRAAPLRVTKECSNFTGRAGSYCSITSSNLPAIQVGASVFYTQAPVDPTSAEGSAIALDSNVVLFNPTGDWATGRCTLGTTGHGLCTFTDGVGRLAGFHARVAVAPIGGPNFSWIGTYGVATDDDR